jgi:MFS family permease
MSFTTERSRWSDVFIASAAQFLGSLVWFLVLVTLVLAVQRRGGSGLEVSALVIAEALPIVVAGRLIGRLVDRVDSRALLIASGVGQLAACVVLARVESFTATVAAAFALSVTIEVAIMTRQALLPAMVKRDDIPRASAIGQTASSIGMMLGPALAGFLVGTHGPRWTIEIAAIGFLSTIIAGLALRTRRGGPAPAGTGDERVDTPQWTLRSDRVLSTSVWGLTAVMAAIGAVNVVLVFFIIRTLGSSEQMYGLVDSMWTVGLLPGAWLFSHWVRPTTTDATLARRLFGTLGLVALALLLVGSAPAVWWVVPFFLLGGVNNAGLNVLAGTLLGRRVPPEARGRASAAISMHIQGGGLIGYVAGGLLLAVANPRWIVLGCGLLGLLVVFAVRPLISRASAPLSQPAVGLV